MRTLFRLALVVISWLGMSGIMRAGSPSPAPAALNPAAVLAAALANAEARERFGEAPFEAAKGRVAAEAGRWTWTAAAGMGRTDLRVEVTCEAGSKAPRVELSQVTMDAWE